MCINIVEICLGFLLGTFRQFLTELAPHDTIMAGYYVSFFFFFFSIFISTSTYGTFSTPNR